VKILLCSTLYHPNAVGGAERLVQLLAESLLGAGHKPVVVTLEGKRARGTMDVQGVTVHYLPLHNIYSPFGRVGPSIIRKAMWHALDTYNPFMGRAFGQIIDKETPTIVNTHTIAGFSPAVWRAARKRGLPVVHTLYDQYLLCPRNSMFKNGRNCSTQCLQCRGYAWPRKRASELVDVVTGASRFILDRHVGYGYFRRAKQVLTHNAYEPPPATGQPAPARANGGALRIGYLGRLHPTKGVDRLVQAFLSLGSGKAQLCLAGSGTGGDEAALKALAAGNSDISWLGVVEAPTLLDAVDVLVVPSMWHDTAPRVILEAFAHGVPVIGSSRGGIPELIPEGTGWLFDPDNPRELVRLLKRCLSERDHLRSMGAAGRQYSERFRASAFVAEYLEAYETARGAHDARRMPESAEDHVQGSAG